MPFIRSSASKRCAHVIAVILLLNKIMPTYSCYILKGLIYIAIITPLGRQLFSYTKCTKLNMCSSYNIKSVFNTKYAFFICFYIL